MDSQDLQLKMSTNILSLPLSAAETGYQHAGSASCDWSTAMDCIESVEQPEPRLKFFQRQKVIQDPMKGLRIFSKYLHKIIVGARCQLSETKMRAGKKRVLEKQRH